MKILAINKISRKLKMMRSKMPNAAYSNRYLQGEERETVEHKLKILKREFKHIIEKLTYINNFVFADQHKKEAYAHCTHLQIALADPQTEICKRVQSSRHTLKNETSIKNLINKLTMKYFWRLCTIVILFGFTILSGCNNRSERLNETNTEKKSNPKEQNTLNKNSDNSDRKISKAVFFIENSESMFGYVSGFTEYVDVISELAEKPKFAEEKTQREFYFINGGNNLKVTPIGNNPAVLKTKLNKTGFKCGDVTKSNLNSMFQKALEKARKDTISILISDAIYDIGKPEAPMNALATEGKETRSRFIERLGDGDLQTIMIKLHSHFEGYYFPVGGGKIKIKQTRPFYIWVFGETELLNRYFPEEYIKSLKGYADMARFIKFDELNIPFQAVSQNKKGSFRFDRQDKNILNDVKSDRNGQGFQFSFATDFSSLPYSDSYFQTTNNYLCSDDNYTVTSVTKIKKKVYEITSFIPTHLITASTQNSPYCELNISLKNVVPIWIVNTNSDDESNIKSDTSQTFGFKFLTNAISEAYSYKNKEKNITNFTFELIK